LGIFEFAFSLFSLLLGLSLAELLGGFARCLEARRTTRIGWLTPLLAILIFVDVVSFWSSAWWFRDHLVFSFRGMLAVAAFAGAYYIGAYLVFPRNPAAIPDLDEHYVAVRRPVFGIMLGANMVQMIAFVGIDHWQMPGWRGITVLAVFALFVIGNMLVRGRRAMTILLAISVAGYLTQVFF
jgi:hypothetical protein